MPLQARRLAAFEGGAVVVRRTLVDALVLERRRPADRAAHRQRDPNRAHVGESAVVVEADVEQRSRRWSWRSWTSAAGATASAGAGGLAVVGAAGTTGLAAGSVVALRRSQARIKRVV